MIETKLYLPRSRTGLVRRSRLSERLDRGERARLTLVSAPAGFGKTTALADWLAPSATSAERRVAWLALDRGDNDVTTFWTYVVAALRTVAPEAGAGTLALLESTQPVPVTMLLTPLLNDLAADDTELVLVLDDYHVIETPEIHDGLGFLLDHVPPNVHLVVASRTDPPVPLAQLRARGELVEVRASDLRFTLDEATAYLNETMGLELTNQDVTALEARTEGWIAALQLAALSMQGREDVAGFVAGFTGDDRYVVDYLVEEVVQRQPPEVRRFLLETSVLDRMNGALCDAVTGQSGGNATLESLDRGNLLVVPLDDHRRWYRYHHLFGDVLRARLLDEQPDVVAELHARASEWYQQNDEPAAAIRHALAANDFARTADLVELAMPAMRRDRQEVTLRGWLDQLPPEVVSARPVLSIGYVGALLASGEMDGVTEQLANAEKWIDATARAAAAGEGRPAGMVVVDEPEFARLPGFVAVFRAGGAMAFGDVATTATQARLALELLPQDDHLGHGAAFGLLALASWSAGDLELAYDAYADSVASLKRAGHLADVLGCTIAQTDVLLVLGRLRDATRAFNQALALEPADGPVLRGTADMYVGMSAIEREHGDFDAARQLLERSEELGEHTALPQNAYRWRVGMAGVLAAEGDHDGALGLLDEADRVYVGDFSPNVRPVPAVRARLLLVMGRIDDAFAWAHDVGLSADDELTYVREFEHVTLARALLARHSASGAPQDLDDATVLLARLLTAAEAGGRSGTVIEVLLLQALAHQATGDDATALTALDGALRLAEPEGYAHTFLAEGPPMIRLLRAAAQRTAEPTYARRLLADGVAPGTAGSPHVLVDPLSDRERDVLRLLATDLSGPEIAREMFVSLNTVRTHTQRIYTKLDVKSRRAAVSRAAELGLLTDGR